MKVTQFYNTWISPQRWLDRCGVRGPMQLAIGLASLTLSLLLLAITLGLIPDQNALKVAERAKLAEVIASSAAREIKTGDAGGLQETLETFVHRNPEVLSAAVRRNDRSAVYATANHDAYWPHIEPVENTPMHIRVPLAEAQGVWGTFEVTFETLSPQLTWAAWWSTPTVRLSIFMIAGGFFVFYIYLYGMLRVLDPASAAPQRVQLLLDALVEGAVILDDRDNIVMVNHSFATMTFLASERLLGRSLSSFGWMSQENDAPPEFFPWHSARTKTLPERGVLLRLKVGTRHARQLSANVAPIFAADGSHCGSIVTFHDQTTIEIGNTRPAERHADVRSTI